jgi:hypothetical protein
MKGAVGSFFIFGVDGAPWGAVVNGGALSCGLEVNLPGRGNFEESTAWPRARGALNPAEWEDDVCARIADLCKTGAGLRARDARRRTDLGKVRICWGFGVKIFGFFLWTPLRAERYFGGTHLLAPEWGCFCRISS